MGTLDPPASLNPIDLLDPATDPDALEPLTSLDIEGLLEVLSDGPDQGPAAPGGPTTAQHSTPQQDTAATATVPPPAAVTDAHTAAAAADAACDAAAAATEATAADTSAAAAAAGAQPDHSSSPSAATTTVSQLPTPTAAIAAAAATASTAAAAPAATATHDSRLLQPYTDKQTIITFESPDVSSFLSEWENFQSMNTDMNMNAVTAMNMEVDMPMNMGSNNRPNGMLHEPSRLLVQQQHGAQQHSPFGGSSSSTGHHCSSAAGQGCSLNSRSLSLPAAAAAGDAGGAVSGISSSSMIRSLSCGSSSRRLTFVSTSSAAAAAATAPGFVPFGTHTLPPPPLQSAAAGAAGAAGGGGVSVFPAHTAAAPGGPPTYPPAQGFDLHRRRSSLGSSAAAGGGPQGFTCGPQAFVGGHQGSAAHLLSPHAEPSYALMNPQGPYTLPGTYGYLAQYPDDLLSEEAAACRMRQGHRIGSTHAAAGAGAAGVYHSSCSQQAVLGGGGGAAAGRSGYHHPSSYGVPMPGVQRSFAPRHRHYNHSGGSAAAGHSTAHHSMHRALLVPEGPTVADHHGPAAPQLLHPGPQVTRGCLNPGPDPLGFASLAEGHGPGYNLGGPGFSSGPAAADAAALGRMLPTEPFAPQHGTAQHVVLTQQRSGSFRGFPLLQQQQQQQVPSEPQAHQLLIEQQQRYEASRTASTHTHVHGHSHVHGHGNWVQGMAPPAAPEILGLNQPQQLLLPPAIGQLSAAAAAAPYGSNGGGPGSSNGGGAAAAAAAAPLSTEEIHPAALSVDPRLASLYQDQAEAFPMAVKRRVGRPRREERVQNAMGAALAQAIRASKQEGGSSSSGRERGRRDGLKRGSGGIEELDGRATRKIRASLSASTATIAAGGAAGQDTAPEDPSAPASKASSSSIARVPSNAGIDNAVDPDTPMSPTAAAAAAAGPPRGFPAFSDLVLARFFPTGTFRFKVGPMDGIEATVAETGTIEWRGQRFSSISGFSRAVLRERNPGRQSSGGWRDVQIGRVELTAWRTAFVAGQAPPAIPADCVVL